MLAPPVRLGQVSQGLALAVEQRRPALLQLCLRRSRLCKPSGRVDLHRCEANDDYRSKRDERPEKPPDIPSQPLAIRNERALQIAESLLAHTVHVSLDVLE